MSDWLYELLITVICSGVIIGIAVSTYLLYFLITEAYPPARDKISKSLRAFKDKLSGKGKK